MTEKNDSVLSNLKNRIEKSWYGQKWWNTWLLPLSATFFVFSHLRRIGLTYVVKPTKINTIPVVVIGNINVGGTGKTPLTCQLVKELNSIDIRVGIISRGYGSHAPVYPHLLMPNDDANTVGDEPKLLRDRLSCPVVIGPDRNAAIQLMSEQDVDLILSDDGLQHYKMARDYEIVVLDATRKLGNGWLLPAGPLREGAWRLKTVDAVIYNGSNKSSKGMEIVPSAWVNAKTGSRKALDFFAGQQLHAVAGIGNPERFFTTLNTLSVNHKDHVFPDHHGFIKSDLMLADNFSSQIVMTEKDWVKCSGFAHENMWYLEINASLNESLESKLMHDLTLLTNRQAS